MPEPGRHNRSSELPAFFSKRKQAKPGRISNCDTNRRLSYNGGVAIRVLSVMQYSVLYMDSQQTTIILQPSILGSAQLTLQAFRFCALRSVELDRALETFLASRLKTAERLQGLVFLGLPKESGRVVSAQIIYGLYTVEATQNRIFGFSG